jgi:putative sigma-54 modulation protein
VRTSASWNLARRRPFGGESNLEFRVGRVGRLCVGHRRDDEPQRSWVATTLRNGENPLDWAMVRIPRASWFVALRGIGYNRRFHRPKFRQPLEMYEGVMSVQIRISTRHGTLSGDTQSKVIAKLEKLPRLFERLSGIEVTVDLEHRDQPVVDIRVSAEHKHDFVASHQGDELLNALDQAIHKLEQQLRKYKQRIQDHHRSAGTRPAELSGEVGEATA